ncbi:MAG: Rpn family recombination-promoting nuclease/putative transposase [Prevotellaceae bacterium]|jgi:predicted transposase/invertase (TIGR01784 family)|nr:Rpn family recombination-promoting nuclease/putative transposase [Prevotellaceae bacterium]
MSKDKTRTVLSFDYAMKKLLRQKSNFKILEGFLSELLGRDIFIKNILESESNQEAFDDKQTRVDILAEDTNGELMIVEVQYQFEIDYFLRILYGTSRNVVDYLKRGEKYKNIKKVYSVNILYFDRFNNENEYIYHGKTEFCGLHNGKILHLTEEQKKLFEKETAGDLYPEYYLLDVTNFDNVAKSTLDEWIYYFKNSEIKENFTAKGMKEVKLHLDYEKMSVEERRRYDKVIDIKLGWESSFETAKIEGRAEGKAEGRAEGKLEGKIEIARNLLKLGIAIENIAEGTGLSISEIQNLK